MDWAEKKAREVLDRWWVEVNEEALRSLKPEYLNYLNGRNELTRLVKDAMVRHVAGAFREVKTNRLT